MLSRRIVAALTILTASYLRRVSSYNWCRRRTNCSIAAAAAAFLASPLKSSSITAFPNKKSSTSKSSSSSHLSSSCPSSSSSHNTVMMVYPDLCVFDLDACFWDQEMYEMPSMPHNTILGDLNGRGQGVIGVMSGPYQISLHDGSLAALQDHVDGKHGTMKIAFASSADTPKAEQIGRATLKLLEVVPGKTVWDVVVNGDWDGRDINQIGRQPPLSSNKSATHFPRLKQLTGIRYDKMLFYDDCNWGDHCGMVAANCREPDTRQGPAVLRTPNGLSLKDWKKGLDIYAEQAEYLANQQTTK